MPCRVGMRDFFIRTNGDVEVCFFYPSIGNIKEQSAREIWYGPKAQEIRRSRPSTVTGSVCTPAYRRKPWSTRSRWACN